MCGHWDAECLRCASVRLIASINYHFSHLTIARAGHTVTRWKKKFAGSVTSLSNLIRKAADGCGIYEWSNQEQLKEPMKISNSWIIQPKPWTFFHRRTISITDENANEKCCKKRLIAAFVRVQLACRWCSSQTAFVDLVCALVGFSNLIWKTDTSAISHGWKIDSLDLRPPFRMRECRKKATWLLLLDFPMFQAECALHRMPNSSARSTLGLQSG